MAAASGVGRDGRRAVGPDPAEVRSTYASPAAATTALDRFVQGVRDRDEHALSALAPTDDDVAVDRLAAIARNAAALDLVGVDARYVDQVGSIAPDGSWTGVVELTWRIPGFDPGTSRADVLVDFRPDDDGLAVAGLGDATRAGARTPLWLQGELAVARTSDTLVMVHGSPARARAVLDRVGRGVDVVRRVLTDWDGRAVVEVPASAAGLDRALGVESGTNARIAAVTASVDGSATPRSPVHVFVNPDATKGFRRAGAQVTMSHELVHLATAAVGSPVEPWLLEGFADYVALREVSLPDRVTLARAIQDVQENGVPRTLPGARDFGVRGRTLQARYEQAWLACWIIAERRGEAALVSAYEDAATGATTSVALRRAGLPLDRLRQAWRARITRMAARRSGG